MKDKNRESSYHSGKINHSWICIIIEMSI